MYEIDAALPSSHNSLFCPCSIIIPFIVNLARDKIVDFHWNSSDPWTIVSVSDDGESTGGGGTLQVLETLLSWCNPHATRTVLP